MIKAKMNIRRKQNISIINVRKLFMRLTCWRQQFSIDDNTDRQCQKTLEIYQIPQTTGIETISSSVNLKVIGYRKSECNDQVQKTNENSASNRI